MGVKLMTGATGEKNIQAADDRECLAGITGLDSYVFPTGSQLKATLVDANTVTIGTGAGSLQGSRFRCPTTSTVTIQSGTQGQYRHDVVGLRFSREASGREGLEFQVLTGDPAGSEGAAADPAYTEGDLLAGDAEAFMPLYRVKLSGINAGEPEPMFSVLTPLASLGESVSPVESTVFSGLPVEGFARGGCVTIYVHGSGVLTRRDSRIRVATLRPGCRPGVPVRTLFGNNSSSWGLIEVDTDGSVYTRHLYGEDSVTWGTVSVSLTFAR